MKAEEVKYKNLVEYDGRIFEIHMIAEEFPALNTDEFGIGVVDWNNIKPIPLTEERLKDFGFEYHEQDECYYNDALHIEDRNEDRYITKELKSKLKNHFGVWQKGRNGLLVDLMYVHQLQNLYYALTGEQLTLKP